MSHYAKVVNGIVTDVIVADEEFINTGYVGDPTLWIQTSYNTYGGVHSKGGVPLRKNFAAVGYVYDDVADAFYSQQPYPSWSLNKESFLWEPPVEYPSDRNFAYTWDETSLTWLKIIDLQVTTEPITIAVTTV